MGKERSAEGPDGGGDTAGNPVKAEHEPGQLSAGTSGAPVPTTWRGITLGTMQPLVWRGITLDVHGPWLWLSADRWWKVQTYWGAAYFTAFLQIDGYRMFAANGDTAECALDAVALQGADFAAKLASALKQISE